MCNCLDCSNITIPTGATGATGPQGPSGANGTDGVDGATLLYNNYSNQATATTSWETLDTFTLPAATLTDDGDMIHLHTVYTSNTTAKSTKVTRIQFDGNPLGTLNAGFYTVPVDKIEYDVYITRLSNTTAKYQLYFRFYQTSIGGSELIKEYSQSMTSLATLNFTSNSYVINAQADGDSAGDITNTVLRIIKYKI